MKIFKKLLPLALSLIILFANTNIVFAGSNSPEKTMEGFLKACKNYNPQKIKSYMRRGTKTMLITEKNFSKTIRKAQKQYLEYEILGSDVKKKTASVTVKLTYCDFTDCFEDSFKDTVEEAKTKRKMSDKQAVKRWAEIFDDYVSDFIKEDIEEPVEPDDLDDPEYDPDDDYGYRQCIVTFNLIKQGGQWKIKSIPKKVKGFYDVGCFNMFSYIEKHQKKYW